MIVTVTHRAEKLKAHRRKERARCRRLGITHDMIAVEARCHRTGVVHYFAGRRSPVAVKEALQRLLTRSPSSVAGRRRLSGKQKAPHPSSWIYFIRAGDDGDIKIGQAQDVARRMGEIQNGCPRELKLLLAVPGDKNTELALHREFRDCHIRREWYSPVPRLLDRIQHLAAEVGGA